MERINRRTADPAIMAAYQAARNERRRPWLVPAATILKLAAISSLLIVAILPGSWRMTGLLVWLCVVGLALMIHFGLLIKWSEPRSRRLALKVTVGFGLLLLAVAAVVALPLVLTG